MCTKLKEDRSETSGHKEKKKRTLEECTFKMHTDSPVQFGVFLWAETPKGLSGGFSDWLLFRSLLIHVWFSSSLDSHQSCKQAHTEWKKDFHAIVKPSVLESLSPWVLAPHRFSVLLRLWGPFGKAAYRSVWIPPCPLAPWVLSRVPPKSSAAPTNSRKKGILSSLGALFLALCGVFPFKFLCLVEGCEQRG